MSRSKSCNYARNGVGPGEVLGGDDIHVGWGTPPQSPASRRYLRRHANKARRRNDRLVIEERLDPAEFFDHSKALTRGYDPELTYLP